jgi:hypothetical protein
MFRAIDIKNVQNHQLAPSVENLDTVVAEIPTQLSRHPGGIAVAKPATGVPLSMRWFRSGAQSISCADTHRHGIIESRVPG